MTTTQLIRLICTTHITQRDHKSYDIEDGRYITGDTLQVIRHVVDMAELNNVTSWRISTDTDGLNIYIEN